MAVFRKGTFSINLGVIQIGGELDEEDRQCAWEFYCEIMSRVTVRGKAHKTDDGEVDVFYGEVLAESFSSLYTFYQESRKLMRRYPVGRLATGQQQNIGFFIASVLEVGVRPFLEKWQAHYRFWWEHKASQSEPPFQRQNAYPRFDALTQDWADLRRSCREAAHELAEQYKLIALDGLIPRDVQEEWLKELDELTEDQDS